eukprot:4305344-Prymnesium_polylepis.1
MADARTDSSPPCWRHRSTSWAGGKRALAPNLCTYLDGARAARPRVTWTWTWAWTQKMGAWTWTWTRTRTRVRGAIGSVDPTLFAMRRLCGHLLERELVLAVDDEHLQHVDWRVLAIDASAPCAHKLESSFVPECAASEGGV